MFWMDPDPVEPVEATWSDFTQLYRDQHKCVTVSEYDHEEKPVVYTRSTPSPAAAKIYLVKVQGVLVCNDGEANGDQSKDIVPSTDYFPQPIITSYFIQSHKGTFACSRNHCDPSCVFYSFLIPVDNNYCTVSSEYQRHCIS